MKPSILYINFENNVDDETIESIISQFYIDNEKAINGMEAQNLKSSVDLSKVKKNSEEFINSKSATKDTTYAKAATKEKTQKTLI